MRIIERRERLGLSQRDVIDRLAGLGATASNRALSAMEHGNGIDVGRLPELAIALECTITYLLGMTGQPQRWTPDAVAPDMRDPAAALADPSPAALANCDPAESPDPIRAGCERSAAAPG